MTCQWVCNNHWWLLLWSTRSYWQTNRLWPSSPVVVHVELVLDRIRSVSCYTNSELNHLTNAYRNCEIPWECMTYLSALVCSRQRAIHIHVYLYLTLPVTVRSLENVCHTWAPFSVFTTTRYTYPRLPLPYLTCNCEIPWECVPYLSALVCSRRRAIHIHVYLYLTLPVTVRSVENAWHTWVP